MKLHWSPRSPYVRKVMVVAHEVGRVGELELVRSVAVMTAINPELSADNPLNKLPTLVLDEGATLFDSPVICDYLDREGVLHPAGRADRIEALRRQALADGLLDMLILWRNERDRPSERQSQPHIAAWSRKVSQTLDWLEGEVGGFEARPFDIGHVATGCALGYLDFRFADLNWRTGRPDLTAWSAAFESRPSAVATQASLD